MKHKAIENFAQKVFKQHGLEGWSFGFDRATVRYGQCRYSDKAITLSRKLVELNSIEESMGTVLHEVAHALAGHTAGHGPQWKAACVRIGAKPETTYGDEVIQPEPKYVVTSGGEEIHFTYQRKPRIKDWHNRWVKGRKEETQGKLMVLTFQEYGIQYG